MHVRVGSLFFGFAAGLAVAIIVVLAATGPTGDRQPDPTFDLDLFGTPTPIPSRPAPQGTSASDAISRQTAGIVRSLGR
jgi:hypothetical protein